jgi:PAS domain-containing protein
MIDVETYVRVLLDELFARNAPLLKPRNVATADLREFLSQGLIDLGKMVPGDWLHVEQDARERDEQEREYREQGQDLFQATTEFFDRSLDFYGANQPGLEQAAEYMLSSDDNLDGFFIKDLSGTYVFVNSAMAGLIGKADFEIVGKTDFDLYTKAEAEFLSNHFSKALKGEMTIYEQTGL